MLQIASMVGVLSSIASARDAQLVGVAALICLLACYTSLTLIARAGKPGSTSSDPWLAAAAAIIGSGSWAVHFVALLALRPDLRPDYNANLALLAVAIGIVCSGLGFALVVRRRAMTGGAIVGAAIAAMSAVDLAALRGPEHAHWNLVFVATSFVFATSLGAASFAAARRWPRASGQLVAAATLSVGVLGAHFLGMAALAHAPGSALPFAVQSIPPIWFSIAVTSICILIIGLGVIGSLVDQHIVELEATRQELERTGEQLRLAAAAAATADKAKSQFLASMSHELRTPLNAILGFSDLLKNPNGKFSDPSLVRNYATNIFESGSHLLALINDILDISKLDADRLELNEEPVDLGRAVESCVRLMGPHAVNANVRMESSVPNGVPGLWADDRRLRQILFNLLSNAVKFTTDAGRVHIGVSWDREGVAIAVSDTGIGMSAEQIPIALDRFGQIDGTHARKYAGTGLGLPLAKRLVELHGGTLAIASEAGVGTTVTVVFPPDRMLVERKVA